MKTALSISPAGAVAGAKGLVSVSGPALGEAELAAVADVFASGYLGMGETTAAFERELAAYLGGEVLVAGVSSGTSALHLACAALGLAPDSEILVPANTFVATFQAVDAAGARPVACDIDPTTGLLDLTDARRKLTPATRAIIPVHYAGATGDFGTAQSFARAHGLRVIEDAAHAFGSRHQGRLIGSFGDITCFSFDPIKNITCGEGGAVVTSDPIVDRRVRAMRRLGIEAVERRPGADPCSPESIGFDVEGPGWRYHLPNLLAAIGRVQLTRFEAELKPHRLHLARLYRSALVDIPGLALLPEDEGAVPHIFPVRTAAAQREGLRQRLRESGFDTLVQYPPVNHLARFRCEGLPGAEQWFRESFTLPLHHRVSEAQINAICAVIRSYLDAAPAPDQSERPTYHP